MEKRKQAFTLVELIVVITILAILWTIAFISLSGYGVSARDSVRLTDIRSIDKGMSIRLTKWEQLPIPDSKIDITASGTVISYQWYAWEKVLWSVWVHGGWKDPLEETYYTYVTNTWLTKYQIMWYFENNELINIVPKSYAWLETRYPKMKWYELWILIDPVTAEPSQKAWIDIDIVNTTESYNIFVNNTDTAVSGTGVILERKLSFRINEQESCDAILRNGNGFAWSGIYTINPTGSDEFEVYCDMETEDGGWTMLTTIPGESSQFGNLSTSGIWKTPIHDAVPPSFLNNVEYMSQAYSELNTDEILLCYENMDTCHNFQHKESMPMFHFFRDNISYTEHSFNLVGYWDQWNEEERNSYFSMLGITSTFHWYCGFFGINNITNNISNTRLAIWYGWDNDGPCISRTNSTSSWLDNYLLGVWWRLWYTWSTGGDIVTPNLAGYSNYDLNNSTELLNATGKKAYLSKTWYILGR